MVFQIGSFSLSLVNPLLLDVVSVAELSADFTRALPTPIMVEFPWIYRTLDIVEEKEYSPIFINDEESPIQNSAQRNRSTR